MPQHELQSQSAVLADMSAGDFVTLATVPGFILGSVVPVFLNSDRGLQGLGTAFCLGHYESGDALYATARHVVETIAARPIDVEAFLMLPKSTTKQSDALNKLGARITCLGVADRYSDVAVLVADTTSTAEPIEGPLRGIRLSLAKPTVGDRCLALGYSKLSASLVDDRQTTMQAPLHASEAFVQELHPHRRDSSMMPFPCFRTSGWYDHGMSGGPIISAANGCVIGVVSSAFDHGTHIAYGALIGSLIELRVDLRDDHAIAQDVLLSDLISHGAIDTDGATVSLERVDDGLHVSWPPG